MDKESLWKNLIKRFNLKIENKSNSQAIKFAIDLMSELPHFNWTGIYWLTNEKILELFNYYVGAHTDHIKIPIGKGVCGTAISENNDIIVDDVRTLDNYLACSVGTRSEIVVLIRDENSKILGQIDIDSDQVSAFDETDRKYMEIIANKLGQIYTSID